MSHRIVAVLAFAALYACAKRPAGSVPTESTPADPLAAEVVGPESTTASSDSPTGPREYSEDVKEVLRKHRAAFELCYDRARQGKPGLGAQLDVGFRIDKEGRVREVRFLGSSTLRDDDAQTCVEKQLRRLRFRRPYWHGPYRSTNGIYSMRYSWDFERD